jgi:predicted amidohydrolase YtcJ
MLKNFSLLLSALLVLGAGTLSAEEADVVLHNGKVVTVDEDFSLAEAIAVAGERILAVGANDEVLKLAGPETKKINLEGKTVLPGLCDSHVHATGASMYEFDHPIPQMETIADVLEYIRSRAEAVEDGKWIVVQQVFIARNRESWPTSSSSRRTSSPAPSMRSRRSR